jgi:hypothetical protein
MKPLCAPSYNDVASSYWKSKLNGAISKPLVAIPKGHKVCPDSLRKREIPFQRNPKATVTVSSMIEAAWVIVFSQYLDVLVHGRNTPLPGIIDLIAPIMAAVPFRIRVDPAENTRTLLSKVQHDLSDMRPYEYLGFAKIGTLSPEAADAIQNAVRIHILPPLSGLQEDTEYSPR